MPFPPFPSAITDNYTISKFLVNSIAKPYILYNYILNKKEQYFDLNNLYHTGNPYVTYEKQHDYAINKASFFNSSLNYTPNALELNDFGKRTIDYIAWINDRKGFVDFENYETSFLINDNYEISKLIFYYSKININGLNTPVIDKKIPAVIFAVKHLEDFIDVLDYFGISKGYGEFYNLFYSLYLEKFKGLKTTLQIINFYKNAPNKYLIAFVENKEISNETIWQHFRILLGGWVPEKKELAILSIIEILSKNSDNSKENANIFLSRLINWTILKENSKGKILDTNKTLFSKLYSGMNDKFFGENNFTKYINTLYDIWLSSDYSNSDYNEYESEKKYKDSPSVLGYTNEKVFGFNDNRKTIIFLEKDRINVKESKTEYSAVGYGYAASQTRVLLDVNFHLLQPISLVGLTEEGEILNSTINTGKLETKEIMPAFYLKAMDDQLKWQNVSKAAWLALDVLTTFSGVGNIAKFRHLSKLAKIISASKTIATKTKTSLDVYRAVKGVVGVVEISSGVINACLKLSDLENTKYGKEIVNILTILEMASMVGEITGAMKLALNKNAKAIVKNNFEELEKGLDYAVKKGDITEVEKLRTQIEIAKFYNKEELVRQHVNNIFEIREKLVLQNKLKRAAGIADDTAKKFEEACDVRPFPELKEFYEEITSQFPELKGKIDDLGEFRQNNFAYFKTTIISQGKPVKIIEDLAYSGARELNLGDRWLKPLEIYPKPVDDITKDFRNLIETYQGHSKKNDSEVKFIYHFITNLLNNVDDLKKIPDEFIIETKNVYYTCNSCQRELPILKEYVEKVLGKKMTIIIKGNKDIKGGKKLKEYLNN